MPSVGFPWRRSEKEKARRDEPRKLLANLFAALPWLAA
jgi:hypothetical protein